MMIKKTVVVCPLCGKEEEINPEELTNSERQVIELKTENAFICWGCGQNMKTASNREGLIIDCLE